MQLFLERAASARGGYAPPPPELAQIASLVRALDGLPLAIELAAARMRVLSPAQLLSHLAGRFQLLASKAGSRQATLRGTIDWSWALLAPHERTGPVVVEVLAAALALVAAAGTVVVEPVRARRTT